MTIVRAGAITLGSLLLATLPACHAAVRPGPVVPQSGGAAPSPGEIRRTLIESRPATGLPGWETRLYLIEYGQGAVAPLHVHPVVGLGRVLEGAFESAFGDGAPVQVHAGQGFVDPPGIPHRLFRNVSEHGPLRFVIAYSIREGEQIFYPGADLPASTNETKRSVTSKTTDDPLTIERPGLYPETIDYDPTEDGFLVGSMREGGIYRIGANGAVSPLVEDPRLTSVLGIAIDPQRRRVWAANADLGVGVRSSTAGPKMLAAVGQYDLGSGRALRYVDLARLLPGPHLLNGIALDTHGDAYVTDSFAKAIYRVTAGGDASVFLTSDQFAGPGVNLNGLVVHPGGYLLVVKKSDGALFRVPLANPAAFSRVKLEAPLLGGDGLALTASKELVVVANKVPGAATNAVLVLSSDDDWRSATVRATQPLGDVYPTTAVMRAGRLFVLHSNLDELLQSAPDRRAALQRKATVQPVGRVRLGDTTAPRLEESAVKP